MGSGSSEDASWRMQRERGSLWVLDPICSCDQADPGVAGLKLGGRVAVEQMLELSVCRNRVHPVADDPALEVESAVLTVDLRDQIHVTDAFGVLGRVRRQALGLADCVWLGVIVRVENIDNARSPS